MYGTFAYISFEMGKNLYYNKKLARFGKDIYQTDPEHLQAAEKEEYNKLREYFDGHVGRQIMENIHSTKFLGEKVKEKLTELEVQRIRVMNSMVGVTDDKALDRYKGQLQALDKEIDELNNFRDKVRKERFYDMFADEDSEQIN